MPHEATVAQEEDPYTGEKHLYRPRIPDELPTSVLTKRAKLMRNESTLPHTRAETPKKVTHHHDDDESEEDSLISDKSEESVEMNDHAHQ